MHGKAKDVVDDEACLLNMMLELPQQGLLKLPQHGLLK